jgi:hypothetical protein
VNNVNGATSCVSTQCPCRKFGYSCEAEPYCFCKNCDNVNGKRESSSDNKGTKRIKTPRMDATLKSAGKLKCVSTKTFFLETDQKLTPSIWSEKETLLLAVVIQTVQATDLHLSVKKITELFNLYSINFPDVRKKTQGQVTFKMRYLRKYRNICN